MTYLHGKVLKVLFNDKGREETKPFHQLDSGLDRPESGVAADPSALLDLRFLGLAEYLGRVVRDVLGLR